MSLVPISLTISSLLGDLFIADDCFELVLLHVLPYLYFGLLGFSILTFRSFLVFSDPRRTSCLFQFVRQLLPLLSIIFSNYDLETGNPLYQPRSEKKKEKRLLLSKRNSGLCSPFIPDWSRNSPLHLNQEDSPCAKESALLGQPKDARKDFGDVVIEPV